MSDFLKVVSLFINVPVDLVVKEIAQMNSITTEYWKINVSIIEINNSTFFIFNVIKSISIHLSLSSIVADIVQQDLESSSRKINYSL